jgi:hypothetical protein
MLNSIALSGATFQSFSDPLKKMHNYGVLSASMRWAKKLFKASSLRQGVRVSGVHPAV